MKQTILNLQQENVTLTMIIKKQVIKKEVELRIIKKF